MKKSLALILTFIMVLALVPSVALAEGEEGKVTITKALDPASRTMTATIP